MAPLEQNSDGISKLHSRISALEIGQATMVASIDNITKSVTVLTEKVNRGPNWGVLASWTGIMITFIGIIGSIVFVPLRESLLKVETKVNQHVGDKGHPDSILAAVGKNREDILRMEKRSEFIQEWLRKYESKTVAISSTQTEKISSLEKGVDKIWNFLNANISINNNNKSN